MMSFIEKKPISALIEENLTEDCLEKLKTLALLLRVSTINSKNPNDISMMNFKKIFTRSRVTEESPASIDVISVDDSVKESSGSVASSDESEFNHSSPDERINCRLEMQLDFQSYQAFKFLATKEHKSVKNLILDNLSPEFKQRIDKCIEFLKTCDNLGL